MQYLVHTPRSPLAEYVEYLWWLSDQPAHARERILPTGTLELVINLAQDEISICADPAGSSLRRFPGAVVGGCYTKPFVIDTRAHVSLLGAHFRPGAAASLLGIPAGALANSHVALEAIWGKAALELRDRLGSAGGAPARLRIAEQALSERLVRARRPLSSIRAALQALARPGAEVAAVARALGISRRRLSHVFTEEVGISPKRYARVCRFQRALGRSARLRSPSWAELALECGYYDQAHLCRDWIELTGSSPSALFSLRDTPVKDHHVALPG